MADGDRLKRSKPKNQYVTGTCVKCDRHTQYCGRRMPICGMTGTDKTHWPVYESSTLVKPHTWTYIALPLNGLGRLRYDWCGVRSNAPHHVTVHGNTGRKFLFHFQRIPRPRADVPEDLHLRSRPIKLASCAVSAAHFTSFSSPRPILSSAVYELTSHSARSSSGQARHKTTIGRTKRERRCTFVIRTNNAYSRWPHVPNRRGAVSNVVLLGPCTNRGIEYSPDKNKNYNDWS